MCLDRLTAFVIEEEGVFYKWVSKYPNRGYGQGFFKWVVSKDKRPYGSKGNGAAMRVSPIGWYFNTENEVLKEAKRSAEITHNSKQGIESAQAVGMCIYLSRMKKSKGYIKNYIEDNVMGILSKTKIFECYKDFRFEDSKYRIDELINNYDDIESFLEISNG